MPEYIEREALQKRLNRIVEVNNLRTDRAWFTPYGVNALIEEIPAANVRPVVRVKWEDVHIDRPEIADLEVASMFCPNCNRWHNKVYHYGNPIEFANFCSFCGADMREES